MYGPHSATLSLIDMAKDFSNRNLDLLNVFGKVILSLPYIAPFLVFVAMVMSSIWWSNWRRTRLIIALGWSLSFFLPFTPALVPIEFLFKLDWDNALQPVKTAESIFDLKIDLAINYIFALIPLLVTFPGGTVRACIRIRGLLPE